MDLAELGSFEMFLSVLLFFGCLTNLLAIFVFTRKDMIDSAVELILLALAFVDFFILAISWALFLFPIYWAEDVYEWRWYVGYATHWLLPCLTMAHTASIYLVVGVSIERWYAVCRSYEAHTWCTLWSAFAFISFSILGSVACHFPRFYEYGHEKEMHMDLQLGWLKSNTEWFHLFYYGVLCTSVDYIAPFALIAFTSFQVLNTLRVRIRRHSPLTSLEKAKVKHTIMLYTVVCVFVICEVAVFTLNMIDCIFPNTFKRVPDWQPSLLNMNDHIVVLTLFNASAKALVYPILFQKFRDTITESVKSLRPRLPKIEIKLRRRRPQVGNEEVNGTTLLPLSGRTPSSELNKRFSEEGESVGG